MTSRGAAACGGRGATPTTTTTSASCPGRAPPRQPQQAERRAGDVTVLPVKRPSSSSSSSSLSFVATTTMTLATAAATSTTTTSNTVDSSRGGGGGGGSVNVNYDAGATAGAPTTLSLQTLSQCVSPDGEYKKSNVLNAKNLFTCAFRSRRFSGLGGENVRRQSDARKVLDSLAEQGFVHVLEGYDDGRFKLRNEEQWTHLHVAAKKLIRSQKNTIKQSMREKQGGKNPKAVEKVCSVPYFQCWDSVCQMPPALSSDVWNILTVEMMETPSGEPWGETLKQFFTSQPFVHVDSFTPECFDDLYNLNEKCCLQNISVHSIDVLIILVHGQKLHSNEIRTKKQRRWLNQGEKEANGSRWNGMPTARPQFPDGKEYSCSAGELYSLISEQFPSVEVVVFDSCYTLFSEKRCQALRPFLSPHHRFMSWDHPCTWQDGAAREKAFLIVAYTRFQQYMVLHPGSRSGWGTSGDEDWQWNDEHLHRLNCVDTPSSWKPSPPPADKLMACNTTHRWFRVRSLERRAKHLTRKEERRQAQKERTKCGEEDQQQLDDGDSDGDCAGEDDAAYCRNFNSDYNEDDENADSRRDFDYNNEPSTTIQTTTHGVRKVPGSSPVTLVCVCSWNEPDF
ncbi:hypothetical protein Pelo_18268 [Pelomyxa schiedti]|nr:hypothetical protein Pelo_18268 [Pelomyxa schiedti]